MCVVEFIYQLNPNDRPQIGTIDHHLNALRQNWINIYQASIKIN